MTLQSNIGTSPLSEPPGGQNRRSFLRGLGIGILIGIFLSVIVTIIIFNLGFFDQFYVCPPATSVETCPPGDVLALPSPTFTLAPTDEAKLLELTPSPTVTETPDIGATATAACGAFESQFPGTPCPDSTNP